MTDIMSGPELEKVSARVRKWYVAERIRLVHKLSTPYPYGAVKVTPEEQYSSYLEVKADPNRQLEIRQMLYRLYQGDENALDTVEREFQRYIMRMEQLGAKLASGREVSGDFL